METPARFVFANNLDDSQRYASPQLQVEDLQLMRTIVFLAFIALSACGSEEVATSASPERRADRAVQYAQQTIDRAAPLIRGHGSDWARASSADRQGAAIVIAGRIARNRGWNEERQTQATVYLLSCLDSATLGEETGPVAETLVSELAALCLMQFENGNF